MRDDARVDGRPTDDEDESVRVSRCVCSRGIVRRSTVREYMIYKFCLSSVFNAIRMGTQCAWWIQTTHQPRGASPSAVDADVRRRDARGASSEHRARSFVRSFVRSFENVVDETTEARRETRQPRATTKTNGQSNRSTDGIRRDVDARRVSSSVSRPSTRRRLRRRFRLCSRARGQRARAGR